MALIDSSPTAAVDAGANHDAAFDALLIGRRIRHLRTTAGMTLEELGAAVGRAPSQISVLENGRREPRLSVLTQVAAALGVGLADLLTGEAPSHRAALEVELERAQRGPLFRSLDVPPVKVGRTLPTDALEALVRLQGEIQRLLTERAATPEEARRANAELRSRMRAQDNYFPELEAHARDLLAAVRHPGGPLSQRGTAEMAAHLGFSLHYARDLPRSTRSVIDLAHHRIYLPHALTTAGDPRSAILQALAAHVLGHSEPRDYGDFLRQRVEANYLAAALMLPEEGAVTLLQEAKSSRTLSVEDLRDAFGVTYEAAAHRFTNLATRHLGIPVHFMKVHESGTLHKAYENDGLRLPVDVPVEHRDELDRLQREFRQTLAQGLQLVTGERGHVVLVAPLLRVEHIPVALNLTYGAVVITSANAALAVVGHPAQDRLTALPLFAVGKRSADAARASGFTNIHVAGGDMKDLVRLLAEHRPDARAPLLYLAGEDRAGDLAHLLRHFYGLEEPRIFDADGRHEIAGDRARPLRVPAFPRIAAVIVVVLVIEPVRARFEPRGDLRGPPHAPDMNAIGGKLDEIEIAVFFKRRAGQLFDLERRRPAIERARTIPLAGIEPSSASV